MKQSTGVQNLRRFREAFKEALQGGVQHLRRFKEARPPETFLRQGLLTLLDFLEAFKEAFKEAKPPETFLKEAFKEARRQSLQKHFSRNFSYPTFACYRNSAGAAMRAARRPTSNTGGALIRSAFGSLLRRAGSLLRSGLVLHRVGRDWRL